MAKGFKTGGRSKGTENKLTTETKEVLKNFVDRQLNKVLKDFEQLSPKEKMDVLIKLLPYLIPKQQAVSYSSEFESLSDDDLDRIIHRLRNKAYEPKTKD